MQTPPGTLDLRLNLLHYLRRQATITAVLFARRITKLNVHWRNGWAPCETGLAGRSIFTFSQPRVLGVLPHNSGPSFLTQFVPPSPCWNLTNTATPKVGKHSALVTSLVLRTWPLTHWPLTCLTAPRNTSRLSSAPNLAIGASIVCN